MIDTIQIFSPAELLKSGLPTHWRHSTTDTPFADRDGIGYIQRGSISFDDPVTGYHAYGDREGIRYHRASLPRLLHGHNGKLIMDQGELDAALSLLQEKAGEICNATFGIQHCTRVDLVWQFPGVTADFILAHCHARHPRLRTDPVIFETRHGAHSLSFIGSEMKIKIYDKTMEMFNCKGNVVRVEIELHGKRLKEELGIGEKVTKLDFDACYKAYRRIMLGFEPAPITRISTTAEFLAVAEREGWECGGIPAFDLYTRELSLRQIRRIQHDMASCRPAIHQIDWSQLLPADAPPPVAVEVA